MQIMVQIVPQEMYTASRMQNMVQIVGKRFLLFLLSASRATAEGPQQPFGWIFPSFAALLGLLVGWDGGYIGSTLEAESFKQDINQGKHLTGLEPGLIVGIQPAGSDLVSLHQRQQRKSADTQIRVQSKPRITRGVLSTFLFTINGGILGVCF